MSNVDIVEEMVTMIIAQRAYEINAKAIQTGDEMLQQVNNLKR
jgi:flagellar basal-body rod protein FlgG